MPDVDPGVHFLLADLRYFEKPREDSDAVEVHRRCPVISSALEDADTTSAPVFDMDRSAEEILLGHFLAMKADGHREELHGFPKGVFGCAFVNAGDNE